MPAVRPITAAGGRARWCDKMLDRFSEICFISNKNAYRRRRVGIIQAGFAFYYYFYFPWP